MVNKKVKLKKHRKMHNLSDLTQFKFTTLGLAGTNRDDKTRMVPIRITGNERVYLLYLNFWVYLYFRLTRSIRLIYLFDTKWKHNIFVLYLWIEKNLINLGWITFIQAFRVVNVFSEDFPSNLSVKNVKICVTYAFIHRN